MTDLLDNLFVTPGSRAKLCYQGETDPDGRWTEGELRTEAGDISFLVEQGIPRFHTGEGFGWDNDELREAQFRKMGVDPDKLIPRGYDYMVNQWPDYHDYEKWIERIARTDGTILELAVGPGGGLSPLILQKNRDARLIMSDIGFWPLAQWRKFASAHDLGSNLRFAQMDATDLPLRDRSIAAVVSMYGISNIGARAEALREAYRVLQPGGALYMTELLPNHNITPKCPKHMVEKLREYYPQMGIGFKPLLNRIGFHRYREVYMGTRPLVPGEGGLADFCEKFAVTMTLVIWRITAYKPG